jgi:hypothetical protein
VIVVNAPVFLPIDFSKIHDMTPVIPAHAGTTIVVEVIVAKYGKLNNYLIN